MVHFPLPCLITGGYIKFHRVRTVILQDPRWNIEFHNQNRLGKHPAQGAQSPSCAVGFHMFRSSPCQGPGSLGPMLEPRPQTRPSFSEISLPKNLRKNHGETNHPGVPNGPPGELKEGCKWYLRIWYDMIWYDMIWIVVNEICVDGNSLIGDIITSQTHV